MCFTPTISLTTAIIEFIAGTSVWIFLKKSLFNKFFIIFVYLLGFYQFTEYMLCTSNNPILWAKLGYITYTFLPAVALHFIIKLVDKKFPEWLLYIPPVIFSLFAIFTPNFITTSECSTFFVTVVISFLDSKNSLISTLIYRLYYFGFILMTSFLVWFKFKKEKNKIKKRFYLVGLLTIIITLVPVLILIVIFPSLNIMFPSIYCISAFLFVVVGLIGIYLDSRLKIFIGS